MKTRSCVGQALLREEAMRALLGGAGAEGLESLLDRATLVELEGDEVLIEGGSVRDAMFVVLQGSLRVFLEGAGEHVAEIGAGDTVGELSVLDRQPASATVRAAGPCRLARLDEETFWGLVQLSHAFALSLLMRLAARLRANNAAVLQNEQLRRHFEQAALNDALTGVRSRRWLEDRLPRMLARHERDGHPLSLAMVDVDHFKRFNDQHGHQAGDDVLRCVAQTLAARLRPTDLVARYGGEEFAVILPATDLAGARVAAERVRRCLAQTDLHDAEARPLPRVTISVGVAQVGAAEPVQALIARADAALYRAKQQGRNRTVCADD